MASFRAYNGKLFFDFRYRGERCREFTKLPDTPANRRLMAQLVKKLEAQLTLASFDYAEWFPNSRRTAKFAAQDKEQRRKNGCPTFEEFLEVWLHDFSINWRESHIRSIHSTLRNHILPRFSECTISEITKADVLAFRAEVLTNGRKGSDAPLHPKTVNGIVTILGQILGEASDRFEFPNPVARIKRLKEPRPDVQPFTLEQVHLLMDTVRADYRDYLLVRFFTGLRTGELHGLRHHNVDFSARQILVREALVDGRMTLTKSDASIREVSMCRPVYEALQRATKQSRSVSEFVFCTAEGGPLDANNFANRVWYPLLRYHDIKERRPYQTRHTTATLWLASGENPEWISRQLGHASTEMLFRKYSRFVPNLTRNDGCAFDRLITTSVDANSAKAA